MNMTVINKVTVFVLMLVIVHGYMSTTPTIKVMVRGGDHFRGPHWSTGENVLYFVDVRQQKVYRFDPSSGNTTSRDIGYGPVSLVVSVQDSPKMVLLSVRTELYLVDWEAEKGDDALRLLSVVDLGKPSNRVNAGKVDARGRLWFGTMGKEVNQEVVKDQGTLYMMNQYNYLAPALKLKPVTMSNGIAWTSDSKYMFYIDSPTRNIEVFDYNLEKGAIRNRRTIFNFQTKNVTGIPEGITIDSEGNLWVACYNGGKVIKIDSRSGKLLEQHKIPASKVTSVTWGGPDMSILYVTTSRNGLTQAEIGKQPEAGSLFAIEGIGSKGLPENQFIFTNAATY